MSSSPLRIWPGVAIVAAVWLSRFGAPVIGAPASTEFLVRVLGGLVGGAAIVAWWLFFSRAPWAERLGVVALLIASLASTWLAGDKSIQVWILWYSAPLLGLALVGALVATRGQDPENRRATTAAAILLTCAATTLVKIVGVTGNGVAHFTWRWTDSPEDRLLARPDEEPQPAPAAENPPASVAEAEGLKPATALRSQAGTPVMSKPAAPARVERYANWPGFRGADRTGVIRGLHIDTDWTVTNGR